MVEQEGNVAITSQINAKEATTANTTDPGKDLKTAGQTTLTWRRRNKNSINVYRGYAPL